MYPLKNLKTKNMEKEVIQYVFRTSPWEGLGPYDWSYTSLHDRSLNKWKKRLQKQHKSSIKNNKNNELTNQWSFCMSVYQKRSIKTEKRKNVEAYRCQKMSEGKSLFSWIVTGMVWVGCAFVIVSQLLQGMVYNACKAWMKLEWGSVSSILRNIGKVEPWRWLSNRSEMVSIGRLWRKNMKNSMSKSLPDCVHSHRPTESPWGCTKRTSSLMQGKALADFCNWLSPSSVQTKTRGT